jgi:hypothetical protein
MGGLALASCTDAIAPKPPPSPPAIVKLLVADGGRDAGGALVVDSTAVAFYGGQITYTETRWAGVLYAYVRSDSQRVVQAWTGGSIDTLRYRGITTILVQDTLAVGLYISGSDTVAVNATWGRRISDEPPIYRLDGPGAWCPSSVWDSGTVLDLGAPARSP